MREGSMKHGQTKAEETAPNGNKLYNKKLRDLWSSQQISFHYYQTKQDDEWDTLTLIRC
jgi:hypothetical protein